MRSCAFALAVAVAVASSGCGVLMMDPPRGDRPRYEPPACSTGTAGVALDAILAVAAGLGALGAAATGEGGSAVTLGLVSGAFIGSAFIASNSARRCRAANQDFKREMLAAGHDGPEGGYVEESVTAAEVEPEPAADPDPEPEPATASTEPAAVATPAPAPAPDPAPSAAPASSSPAPAATSAPAPSPRRPSLRRTDRGPWSDFWQEVP
jgi:hypothetical protein